MILTVDITSDVPIYQQLRDRVVEAIADGRLAVGDSLPATRALAADFGINFHTVNKAYDVLRQQGLVRVQRKTGATVSKDQSTGPPDAAFTEDWTARARTLLAEAVANGMPAAEVQERCRALLDGFVDKGRTS
ncbi:GntR family transcriptional regulator [Labedaea rhizosphaerae]|uniref:DNA-binding transcriptional regulator YhcF (GntR family) n=1 Tax=Labedaea rhizosphaerae TaxID=598644 RepID=A0A4R6SBK0_LABRH|nr:GntR family transcriptional regulator [Labedaea rhizosphaerae]TDP97419.1 DNA-binding transcriptional regulator YhcF (GntR family) [Labedaea rhizosphaerae]